MYENTVPREQLDLRAILKTWWPLAVSWLLMGVESPAISAVIARLAYPEINLAAYGGVVYPLALVIESPIIMLLAASTALSKDWASYLKMRRFMMVSGAILTTLHILLAFTPLYDVVIRGIIGAPEEIIEPARLGLRVMLPWSWAIAYRRFHQGVMIRYGHSNAVWIGTIVRLMADVVVLSVCYLVKTVPGAAMGAGTHALGVLSEATYIGWRVQPILRNDLRPAEPVPPLTWRAFANFYLPLVLTSLLSLLWQPIGSAAFSRMPQALSSLAVWPVLSGVTFVLRTFGMAYNEVVVALLSLPGSYAALKRFATLLTAGSGALHLLISATPLAIFWFQRVSALPGPLAEMAYWGFWLSLPMTLLAVLQSWYQGAILFDEKTRGIPESVAVFFGVVLFLLGAGIVWGRIPGLYVGMGAFALATLVQVAWLWYRSRPVMRMVRERDAAGQAQPVLTVESLPD